MAVAIEMTFEGATTDQYDEILKLMGLDKEGATPPDALFHWCAKSDKGLHIVDVWKTQAAFDKFAQEQIGPFSAQVGVGEPKMQTFEVYNFLIGKK